MKGLILNNSIINSAGLAALRSRSGLLRNSAIIVLLVMSLTLHAADRAIDKVLFRR